MRGPECNPDGKYEEVQCKTLTKECWCVDASGLELTGSRTTKYPIWPKGRIYKKKTNKTKSNLFDENVHRVVKRTPKT